MGTTLRVTHTNDQDRTGCMPRYTEFYTVLDGIANKIEEPLPALAAEMRDAIHPERFHYFDFTTLDQQSFHVVAQAIVDLYREALVAMTQHQTTNNVFDTLAELIALITFDSRCILSPFPAHATIVIDDELTWQGQGWIYVAILGNLIMIAISPFAYYENRPDLATYLLNILIKNNPICDLREFRNERWSGLSPIVDLLRVRFERSAEHLCSSKRFEAELQPAAKNFAELFLGKYPFHDPELEE